jgi:hypothetical protein
LIRRPEGVGAFQFVILSTLRAAQLIRGCTPRIDSGHKAIVTAQMEVAEGKVTQLLFAKAEAIAAVANLNSARVEDVRVLVETT